MNNKERCIKMLSDFDENQLASIAGILQYIKNFATCVDTHKDNISIFKSDFSNKREEQKLIQAEIDAYRKELEAEKTSLTLLHLENSKKEA